MDTAEGTVVEGTVAPAEVTPVVSVRATSIGESVTTADIKSKQVVEGLHRLFKIEGKDGIWIYARPPKKGETEATDGVIAVKGDKNTPGVYVRCEAVEKLLAAAVS